MTDDNNLKPLAELVLIGEIVLQCNLAERAVGQLAEARGLIEKWGSIQSLLVATANVSKILWPTGRYEARGEHLRELLGVDDETVLSIRPFRNHFEHYDERIDRWFENNDSVVYKDLGSDPQGLSVWGLPTGAHRNYDPISGILTFRSELIDLMAVAGALADILERCRPFALVDQDQWGGCDGQDGSPDGHAA